MCRGSPPRSGHHATDSGHQRLLLTHSDDAGGSADDIDDISQADVRRNGIPVGVERADRDGNTGTKSETRGPFGAESAGDAVGSFVASKEFLPDASQ